MFIVPNSDNSVAYIGILEAPGCVEYNGPIPDDFGDTFALGKYKFVDGEIVLVDGWTPPVIVDPTQE